MLVVDAGFYRWHSHARVSFEWMSICVAHLRISLLLFGIAGPCCLRDGLIFSGLVELIPTLQLHIMYEEVRSALDVKFAAQIVIVKCSGTSQCYVSDGVFFSLLPNHFCKRHKIQAAFRKRPLCLRCERVWGVSKLFTFFLKKWVLSRQLIFNNSIEVCLLHFDVCFFFEPIHFGTGVVLGIGLQKHSVIVFVRQKVGDQMGGQTLNFFHGGYDFVVSTPHNAERCFELTSECHSQAKGFIFFDEKENFRLAV